MAEVYWIHLPEHTDMFSEGYIGITSKTTKERFRTHLKEAKRKDRKKYRIHNALAKYKDVVIVETLVICDEDYAIDLESKLRPLPRIGWNTLAGGQNVKLLRDIKDVLTHTEDSKQKMSKSQKSSWVYNKDVKLSALLASRRSIPRPLDEEGIPTKFWVTRYKNSANMGYWFVADELYNLYKSNQVCTSKDLMNHLSVPHNKKQWFQTILRYFDGGWVPQQDNLWVEDFKIEGGFNNGP